jgi:hypothetical protein
MRVRIAGEQHCLEENHDGIPNRRGTAEERQEELADQWLNGKEQDCAQEDGRAEDHRERTSRNAAVLRRASFANSLNGFIHQALHSK